MNWPLVVSAARQYRPRGYDIDDAVSEATIAALNALTSFDPERGTLGTWLTVAIRHHLTRLYVANNTQGRRAPGGVVHSLDDPIPGRADATQAAGVPDRDPAEPVDRIVDAEERRRLLDALDQLDEADWLITVEHFGLAGDAKPLRDVAADLKLSRDVATKRQARALRQLSEILVDL